MTPLLMLLQASVPVASATEPPRFNGITEAEARATAAPVLARRVLGSAGEEMVEATVHGSWRQPFGGTIDFVARPGASDWGKLCTATTVTVHFVSTDGTGDANLPHHVLGLTPGRRYRLLGQAAGEAPAAACPSSPALATEELPGFFVLACGWRSCDDARTALFAAEVVGVARQRLSQPGFMRCRPSQAMGDTCPDAMRRVRQALTVGLPLLSVHACHGEAARACIVAPLPPDRPLAQLNVRIATGLPMEPAALVPGRADATGLEIAIDPPVVVE